MESGELRFLLERMSHRGPDASATISVSKRALLGCNRLRITDASNQRADMPMVSRGGHHTIVYNGEVYNHTQLREQLPDYQFETHSDAETVLAAFEAWGPSCVERFEGMFALCIYSKRDDSFFFARDPSGQKPLYVLAYPDGLVFASEITALIQDPIRTKTWNRAGLAEYVSQRMILGSDTHIREITKLEAGRCLHVEPTGVVRGWRYYQVPIGDQERTDVASVRAEIRRAVQQGCRRTFDVEVPHGLLLSGGVDSTAVLSLLRERREPVRAYTIGFAHFEGENHGMRSTFSELDHARLAAKTFGAECAEQVLQPREYCELIDMWGDVMGEPLDSSEAPCLDALFRMAKAAGERVIFCGSGPDEVFDGYGFGRLLVDASAASVVEQYHDKFAWNDGVDLSRLLFDSSVRANVLHKLAGFLRPYAGRALHACQLAQLITFHGRCVDYEYRQMDLLSMRHSIEARVPLADRGVTTAAFSFDPTLKHRDGVDKWIFKEALRGLLPDRIVDRRKEAFPTPVELWFHPEYQERESVILEKESALSASGVVDTDYVRALWATGRPEPRYAIGCRLYLLNRLLEAQKAHVS
jgi:asparagine synthase (glutamine-hydrolysing)